MNPDLRRALPRAEKVEIDYSKWLVVPGRKTMYPLPLRGRCGRVDDLVLGLNVKVLALCPGAAATIAVNGGLLLVGFLSICVALFLMAGSFDLYGKVGIGAIDVFFVAGVVAAAVVALVFAIKKQFRTVPIGSPLLINRLSGVLMQQQGRRRVEAQWGSLVPYIELIHSVSSTGAFTSCCLHLIEPSADGRRAQRQILVQTALGIYECLSTYEFIALYMEGKWEELSEIHLMPREKPGFWDSYRFGFFNPWIGVPRWRERSPGSRRWMCILVPLWTVLFWPLVIFGILGARFGYMPRFSAQDLDDARYEPEKDGPPPEIFSRIIKPPQPMAPGERILYSVSLTSGALAWLAGALWFASLPYG